MNWPEIIALSIVGLPASVLIAYSIWKRIGKCAKCEKFVWRKLTECSASGVEDACRMQSIRYKCKCGYEGLNPDGIPAYLM